MISLPKFPASLEPLRDERDEILGKDELSNADKNRLKEINKIMAASPEHAAYLNSIFDFEQLMRKTPRDIRDKVIKEYFD